MNYIIKYATFIFSIAIMLIAIPVIFVFASESNGTIDENNKLTKICKNESCSSFGQVNWKPTINASTPGAQAVSITDSGLTGHLWGSEIGWINLKPSSGGVNIDPNTGVLSGTAFANTGSWINFKPSNAGPGSGEVGVKINGSGEFSGYAYVSGLNGGWMKFDCSSPSTCIKTDWKPIPNRSGGQGGGSGGGGTVDNNYIIKNKIKGLKIKTLKKSQKVDIFYFNAVMVYWDVQSKINGVQDCYNNDIADINCDGIVNDDDVRDLLLFWNQYVDNL